MWKIRRYFTATNSPDSDGEWFELTTEDGTRYGFGQYASTTNSTWEVTVFGNQSNEPCYNATWSAAWCKQGWRFNLDQITDTNDNSTDFLYERETNKYGSGNNNSWVHQYTRGGHLKEIRYGRNISSGQTQFRARVLFTLKDRCTASPIGSCAWNISGSTSTPWYIDSPTDLECTSSTSCPKHAPAFFTKKMVTDIRTGWSSNGSSWTTVDTYTLATEWPDSDGWGGVPAQLWLREIRRSGNAGTLGPTTLPAVRFESYNAFLDNRDDSIYMPFWRVDQIQNEHGAKINATYAQPYGCSGQPSGGWQVNTQHCYPAWTVVGTSTGWGLFNKYVVTQVSVEDATGVSPTMYTSYTYLDAPAWRYDQSYVPSNKSWSQFRGHGAIRETVGAAGATQTVTEYRFFRGMHGDNNGSGGTKSVSVTDALGSVFTDSDHLAGLPYDVRELSNPATSQVGRRTLTRYWTQTNSADSRSKMVRPNEVIVDTWRPSTATWQRTQLTTIYDSYGRTVDVLDKGDTSTSIDDRCTNTQYTTPNTSLWIMNRVTASVVKATNCTSSVWLAWSIYHYDNQAYGAAPSQGNITKQRHYDGAIWSDTDITYNAGRVEQIDGPLATSPNDIQTFQYHSSHGMLTSTTNALGHVTTTVVDRATGLPTLQTDPNTKTTNYAYDGLGRLRKVWRHGEPTNAAASVEFTYTVSKTTPDVVKTSVRQIGSIRLDEWVYYDGLSRQTQQQKWTPNKDYLQLAEVLYDTRGNVVTSTPNRTFGGTPGTAYIWTAPTAASDVATYDSLNRPTMQRHIKNSTVHWQTNIDYDGWDRTIVSPFDASPIPTKKTVELYSGRGQLTTSRQYTTTTLYDQTSYSYDRLDRLVTTTNPLGQATTVTYDNLGRRLTVNDPDSGTTVRTYDTAGNIITETTPAGTIWNKTDALARPTERRTGTASGTLLAKWVYDKSGEKGLLDYTLAYNDAIAYKNDIIDYDPRNRPTGTTWTIPTHAGWTDNGLAGNYSFTNDYDLADHITATSYPAGGGLAAETVTTTYNTNGFPTAVTGADTYMTAAQYTWEGWAYKHTLGAPSTTAYSINRTFSWNYDTGQLNRLYASRELNGALWTTQDENYTYDTANNITQITNDHHQQRTCFGYNKLHQLIYANTRATTSTCADTSTSTAGPAPYSHRYTYDPGNRITSFGPHNTAGNAGVNTYTYADANHPNAPTTITTPAGANTYTYDTAGNRKTANNATGTDYNYTWDNLGRLESANNSTAPTHRATTSNQRDDIDVVITTPASTVAGDTLLTAITTPFTTGAAVTEAENADLNGPIVETGWCPCSGSGSIGGFSPSNNSHYVEISYLAPAAGTYRIATRYGAGAGTASRAVIINGTNKGALTFPSTPGWSDWNTTDAAFQLAAGTNTIRIQTQSGSYGWVNLDTITVIPDVPTYEAETRP